MGKKANIPHNVTITPTKISTKAMLSSEAYKDLTNVKDETVQFSHSAWVKLLVHSNWCGV